MKKNLLSLALFILIGVLSRVIPHPWNFTGITAMALFAGLLAKENKFLFLAPLASLFVSDLILGFHNTMIYTYLGFAIVGLLSLQFASQHVVSKFSFKNMASIFGYSAVGSLVFFIISNFGVWYSSSMYPHSLSGLVSCYVAGLPFLDNQFLGDLSYSFVFMMVYHFLFSKRASNIAVSL